MEHGGGGHEIGVHKLAHLAGLTVNIDTIYMTWLSMAIVILLAYLATRRLALVPSGWQNAMEMIITALLDQMESTMGPKGKKLAPLIITLFLFLLVSNWMGLVPTLTSPTNDLNTTLGLALLVIALVHILGIANKGIKAYVAHYFQPYIPFVIINVIEEAAKPVTMAFRLFGNIIAGEIMIVILGKLVPMWIPIPNIVWLGFSVFVGVVQAFIFTILTITFLSIAMKKEH